MPKDYVPSSYAEWMVDFYVHGVMEDTPGDWAMEVESEGLVELPCCYLYGHRDVGAIAPDASAVNLDDLKSGKNAVDIAECNWQVLGYAGLYKGEYGAKLKRVCAKIRQPGNDDETDPRVSSVVIEGAQLENVLPFLNAKIAAALANPMQLNTGLKQCRWCDADLQCPAFIAFRKRMQMILTKEQLEAVHLTPDDKLLAEWVIAKRMLESKLKKAAELCKERLTATGQPIVTDEGTVQLVDSLGNREIEKIGPVWEDLAATLDPEDAYACISLRIGESEKRLAKALSKSTGTKVPHESKDPKKLSGKGEFTRRFGDFITRKPGKELTIVV